jgi:predicted Zn-dependent peptidase
VVNVLYKVGARNEDPEKTGFAHLFEHLMFGGSKHAPVFDRELEVAGASNNAFTNNDLTNYYDVIPAQNIETALWLESDRMAFLDINERSLEVQRSVVSEEFKENYLNQPYGQAWHHLRALAYRVHPYRWPTIGLNLKHIEEATLEDVRAFYKRFYHPSNAILTISGAIENEEAFSLAQKWFADIPDPGSAETQIPQEPPQKKPRRKTVEDNVPLDALYMAFHIEGRNDPSYYVSNLLTDILSNGSSSRLYTHLVKEKQIFNNISAWVDGALDPGLLIISGRLNQGISLEKGEEAVWHEISLLQNENIEERELMKVKNKVEFEITNNMISLMHRGFALSYYEMLGDAAQINHEIEKYRSVTISGLMEEARTRLTPGNSSVLYYKRKQ